MSVAIGSMIELNRVVTSNIRGADQLVIPLLRRLGGSKKQPNKQQSIFSESDPPIFHQNTYFSNRY